MKEFSLDEIALHLTNTVNGHAARLGPIVRKLSRRQLERVLIAAARYPMDVRSGKDKLEQEAITIMDAIAGAREEYLSILRMAKELSALSEQQENKEQENGSTEQQQTQT